MHRREVASPGLQKAVASRLKMLGVIMIAGTAGLLGFINCLAKFCYKGRSSVESGQSVHNAAFLVEDVMDAVAGDGPLQLAAVAKVNRHLRRRTHRLPMQDEALLQ